MRSAKIWALLQATQQHRYGVFLVMTPLMMPLSASYNKNTSYWCAVLVALKRHFQVSSYTAFKRRSSAIGGATGVRYRRHSGAIPGAVPRGIQMSSMRSLMALAAVV